MCGLDNPRGPRLQRLGSVCGRGGTRRRGPRPARPQVFPGSVGRHALFWCERSDQPAVEPRAGEGCDRISLDRRRFRTERHRPERHRFRLRTRSAVWTGTTRRRPGLRSGLRLRRHRPAAASSHSRSGVQIDQRSGLRRLRQTRAHERRPATGATSRTWGPTRRPTIRIRSSSSHPRSTPIPTPCLRSLAATQSWWWMRERTRCYGSGAAADRSAVAGLGISTRAVFAPHPTSADDAVPTSIATGPDGALYVGELSRFPVIPGNSNVYRLSG